jgi:hypothetical protein
MKQLQSHICLSGSSYMGKYSEFPYIEENLIFFFISEAGMVNPFQPPSPAT